MSKGWKIFLGFIGVLVGLVIAGYCCYKWLKMTFQNQVLNRENNNLRDQNENIVQQYCSMKRAFVTIFQENHQLKGQMTELVTESKKLLEARPAPMKKIAGFGRDLTTV